MAVERKVLGLPTSVYHISVVKVVDCVKDLLDGL